MNNNFSALSLSIHFHQPGDVVIAINNEVLLLFSKSPLQNRLCRNPKEALH